MSDAPPTQDRSGSPVARGGLRRLKSQKVMFMGAGAAGAVAIVLLGMSIRSAMQDPGLPQRPAEPPPTRIGQVTGDPPPPVVQPAQPAKPAPAPAPAAALPAVIAPPVNYVRFPAGGSDGFFDVPAPAKTDAAKSGADERHDPPGTEVAFKPSVLNGGKAGKAIPLTYVMMPQTIPCALDTALDSTEAGSIICHTTQDVLSPDHILLMPAGTKVVGTYQNTVRTGQRRLFAFAGNAITREGIPIPLDSQMADGLGRTGIPGEVDNHYGKRFGAALLLTAAQMGASILQTEVSKAGQTSLNLNSGGGVEQIAGQILQSQINIPPTIYVPPGAIVSLLIDHPIDFSDAIKVTTR